MHIRPTYMLTPSTKTNSQQFKQPLPKPPFHPVSLFYPDSNGTAVRAQQHSSISSTCVGHIGWPRHPIDLLKVEQLRGQPSVCAKDLPVHSGSYREAVEAVGKRFPKLGGVAALACVSVSVSVRVREQSEYDRSMIPVHHHSVSSTTRTKRGAGKYI